MKYFYSSFAIAIFGFIISFFIGSFHALYICMLLSLLEVSLSFDNAVVSAKVLNDMDRIWRQRFITFGIPVAVFGMRLVFPVLIVSITTNMGIIETLHLAIYDQHKYHTAIEGAKHSIYSFGASFLLLVFLDFFFDDERDIFWIKFLESNIIINFLKSLPNITIIFSTVIGLCFIYFSGAHLAMAYFSAMLLYIVIKSFDSVLLKDGVKSGFMGFLYLEVLDASFSFDGVIGAFALSDDIFIIMIGLGIGAMFVRSMTLYLVEKKTLENFIFLEHGAHYAIFALSVIMFIKLFTEVSEIITGLIGAFFIITSCVYSKLLKVKI